MRGNLLSCVFSDAYFEEKISVFWNVDLASSPPTHGIKVINKMFKTKEIGAAIEIHFISEQKKG